MTRTRLAIPVLVVYWLMLVAGLGFFTAIRSDDVMSVVPLWAGALAGTALGQVLALHDYRPWVTIAVVIGVLSWCVPILPPALSSTEIWMAFVPAALCGFWSLGDRAQLAAFWFPTVIWMLSILDGTSGQVTPDGAGVVLLGTLAVLFIVFLRVRESRRVALWRTIATTPLATGRPTAVLKEPPGRQLARGGWALLISAITFGATAWVAPYLWQTEAYDGGQVQVADPEPTRGLPCCPVHWEAPITRSRVSEYFHIGRGHDELAGTPRQGIDCAVCEQPAIAAGGAIGPDDGVIADGEPIGGAGVIVDDPRGPASGTAAGQAEGDTARPADPWASAIAPSVRPTITERSVIAPAIAPVIPDQAPSVPATQPAADIPALTPPAIDPTSPAPPVVVEAQEPIPTPAPAVEQAAPVIEPAPPPPPATAEPAPARTAPSPAAAPRSSYRPHRAPPSRFGPALLHWIAVMLAAALLFQLTSLGLRPLRRWITLRHLRRPFWDETIDQRVSNSWQLALVGLRDAGWRSTSAEAPREFARRVGAQGLERCATILERARHGVAIDAGDLSEMATSAETAYRSARGSLGRIARAMAWARWPLT
jgi:hypothetical protein